MARLRQNFQGGTISDNPLLIGATSANSASFTSLPVVASPDIIVLVLDPNGIFGAPEITYVTAHTASATTVTITRGQEGSAARQHTVNEPWIWADTALDFAGLALTGEIKMGGWASSPAGWLLCDGSAVNRTTYADLFNAIGTSYGVGDGTTTFNVPDFRGRGPVGAGTGSGLTARALGQTGGEEAHILTLGELAQHSHTVTDPQHSHGINSPGGLIVVQDNTATNGIVGGAIQKMQGRGDVTINNGATGITVQNTGSNTAHNNMQPYGVATFVIKT